VLLERAGKVAGDIRGRPSFDLPPLEHEHDLSVAQQRDGR
jgi:hypothetical protein